MDKSDSNLQYIWKKEKENETHWRRSLSLNLGLREEGNKIQGLLNKDRLGESAGSQSWEAKHNQLPMEAFYSVFFFKKILMPGVQPRPTPSKSIG